MLCVPRRVCLTLTILSYFALAAPAFAATTAHAQLPRSTYASVMLKINPHLRANQSLVYATALLDDSRRLHVDPTLVMAVVTVESHWDARAISYHGAEGLGQLKPETARELGVDPWSGRSNLRGITTYLHEMLSLFRAARQPIAEAIAGYNAGPYAVRRSGGIPQNGQTPHYVAKVMHAWQTLRSRLGPDPSSLAVARSLLAVDAVAAHERSEATYWGVPAPPR
jgi:soluble lytic murein transglycosylase-like protein